MPILNSFKRNLPLVTLLLMSTGLFNACSPSTSDNPDVTASNPSDSLRLLYWQAPTTLNPHLSNGSKDVEAASIVFEPLAAFNEDEDLEPVLAAEIPTVENGGISADSTMVTWKLKEDVLWSDGEPFTAEDVVFTYEFITNPDVASTSNSSYEEVQSVEAIDDLTVQVTFNQPTPAPMEPFVGGDGMILPEHLFRDDNGPQSRSAVGNTAPVGTNAFQVTEFKSGDIIVYEPNPNFRGEAPKFSSLELKGGGDAVSAARAVLQSGEADYAWNVQAEPAIIQELEASGGGEVIYVPRAQMERIYLNFSDPNTEVDGQRGQKDTPHPFLSEKPVRQAISLAIDRSTIAERLYGEAGEVATNFVVAPEKYVSPNTEYEFDLERAASLLDEAGWIDTDNDGIRDRDGVEMSLVFTSSVNAVRQKTQEIIKQNLESIGMAVEIKSVDASVYFGEPNNVDSVNQFNADLQLFAVTYDTPEPDSYMNLYACDEIAQKENQWSGSNYSRYCNPEYEALLEQLANETDPDERANIFIAMNDLLVEDVALIPLVRRKNSHALSSGISAPDFSPWAASTWRVGDWGAK